MTSILRRKRRVDMTEQDKVEKLPATASVSDFAPKRGVGGGSGGIDGLNQAEWHGNALGDPLRLAQVTGLAVEKIGTSTADQIELAAVVIVENAKKGAQDLVDDAHRKADEMVRDAEGIARDMNEFAAGIRTYTERKTEQVASFCSIAESVMGAMHALGDQFRVMTQAETAALQGQNAEIPVPTFLKRATAG
jgi:hypothetical protein